MKHKRTFRHLGIHLHCARAIYKVIKLMVVRLLHLYILIQHVQRHNLSIESNAILLMCSPDCKQYLLTQTLILQKMDM